MSMQRLTLKMRIRIHINKQKEAGTIKHKLNLLRHHRKLPVNFKSIIYLLSYVYFIYIYIETDDIVCPPPLLPATDSTYVEVHFYLFIYLFY